MPWFDLYSPTKLFVEFGWWLVTLANGIVYVLLVAVFVLGLFVRLPRARRDLAAVEAARLGAPLGDEEVAP